MSTSPSCVCIQTAAEEIRLARGWKPRLSKYLQTNSVFRRQKPRTSSHIGQAGTAGQLNLISSYLKKADWIIILVWHACQGRLRERAHEPWQGQSKVFSVGFQASSQPMWGQIAVKVCALPCASLYAATLLVPFCSGSTARVEYPFLIRLTIYLPRTCVLV